MNTIKNIKILLITLLVSQYVFSQSFFEDKAIQLGIFNSWNYDVKLGGVSFFDFDNDCWDDITTACKADRPVKFYKNVSGTFVEQNFNLTITGHSKQVLWVDYDNDGDNDLFVTKVDGANKLYQNNGSFSFVDVTASAGFPNTGSLKTYGAAFGDIDNDGYLDVFLCNKDDSNVIPNQLYRNNGNGTFTNISNSAGISSVGHLSFCASFFDYDKDGYQDIYISNDRLPNKNILYRNNGNGTFSDVSVASATNITANAMSTTIDDYNYDGWLDIYITNTSEGNFLLKNNGNGTFTNQAVSTGTVFNSIGWGAIFFDADNDIDLDLYVSGMIDNPNIGLLTSAFYECQPNYTYTIPANAGFANDNYVSFSNAIGDIDNDGYTDFIVANQAPDNHSLWQNTGGTNNWLKVKLQGVQSNKNGIGSWIEVYANNKTMFRYTLCGEGFLSQNSGTEIFGIGNATTIDYVKVKWLSGVEDIYNNVSPNQTLLVIEGTSTLSLNEDDYRNIKIYPNPSTGIIYFSDVLETTEVLVYDYLGRRIETLNIDANLNQIDLSNYAKGVYLLDIKTKTKSFSKKVILQ